MAEEVVDVRGADQNIESLVAGHSPLEAVAILGLTFTCLKNAQFEAHHQLFSQKYLKQAISSL